MAQECERLVNKEGRRWAHCAVLYRTNAQSEQFEDALASADIAYTVRGSERFFDRAEIRRAITLLRGQSLAEPNAAVRCCRSMRRR